MAFADEMAAAMGDIVEGLGRSVKVRRFGGGTRDYTAGTRSADEDQVPVTAVRSEVLETSVSLGQDRGRVWQTSYVIQKSEVVFDAAPYTPTKRDKIVDEHVWDIVGVHEHAEGTAWMIRVERG